jgi:hypothetical protein
MTSWTTVPGTVTEPSIFASICCRSSNADSFVPRVG